MSSNAPSNRAATLIYRRTKLYSASRRNLVPPPLRYRVFRVRGITFSATFTIIERLNREMDRSARARNSSSRGRATQKRNITPGTHKGSAAYDETDDGRISLVGRVIGIPGHKKVRRGVLDDPSSTGHAPDRSRYFIRSYDIFQAGDRR